jgi:hypothetical protein
MADRTPTEKTVLHLKPEKWAVVPGTTYKVRVGTIRHRIASRPPDTVARSMLTVILELRDGATELLREHMEPGETVESSSLRLKLFSVKDDAIELEVG